MNEQEKEIIIELLLKKYKKTRDEKLLDLAKKVNKTNIIIENMDLSFSKVIVDENIDNVVFDAKNPTYKNLDLSHSFIKVSNSGIKIINKKTYEHLLNIKQR